MAAGSWERLVRSILRELMSDLAMRIRAIEAKIDSIDRRLNDLGGELRLLRDEVGKRRRFWP